MSVKLYLSLSPSACTGDSVCWAALLLCLAVYDCVGVGLRAVMRSTLALVMLR